MSWRFKSPVWSGSELYTDIVNCTKCPSLTFTPALGLSSSCQQWVTQYTIYRCSLVLIIILKRTQKNWWFDGRLIVFNILYLTFCYNYCILMLYVRLLTKLIEVKMFRKCRKLKKMYSKLEDYSGYPHQIYFFGEHLVDLGWSISLNSLKHTYVRALFKKV